MNQSDSPASTHPDTVFPQAEETPTPPVAPLSVRIEGDLVRAVQKRAARSGLSVDDIVREAVKDMLQRERAEQNRQMRRLETRPEQMTLSLVCDDDGSTVNVRLLRSDITHGWRRDIFTAATQRSNDLYALAVEEVDNSSARNAPQKYLLLREFRQDFTIDEGSWVGNAAFHFPVSKIGWLIGALGRAQQALKVEARANREAAHQARRLRAPEEVDQEQEQRQTWTEKRGREAWQRAVTLANQHKNGAARMDRTNHFTAWEWLELCARFGFRCPLCGVAEGDPYPEQGRRGRLRARAGKEVHLQPHHRQELSRGGDNIIENILPLCTDCHSEISSFTLRLDAAPDWLETQRAQGERLAPGTLVTSRRDMLGQHQQRPPYPSGQEPVLELTRRYPTRWSVGVIVAVNPPERVGGASSTDSLPRLEFPCRHGLRVDGDEVSVWQPAAVRVRWQKRRAGQSTLREQTYSCSLLCLDQETACWYRDKWMEEQEKNRVAFAVGDLVRPKETRRTHRSQIVQILPPDPALLTPIRAIIRDTAGKKEQSTIELVNLVKVADAT